MSTRPVTVLQDCLNEMRRRVAEMPFDINDPDKGSLWNHVEFGSITDRDVTMFPIAGIYEGQEEVVNNLFPLVEKNVAIFIEFRFSTDNEVDPYDEYRYYVGRLQALLFGDNERLTLGGRANNLYETGNNPEIEGRSDPAPGGVLMMILQYEHINGDPYKDRRSL